MTLDKNLERIATLSGVHGIKAKIVKDEQVNSNELAQFDLVGVVEPGMTQGFKHAVSANSKDGITTTAGDVSEGVGEKSFANTHGTNDGHMSVSFNETQRDKLVQNVAVEIDFGGVIPSFELHVGFEMRSLSPNPGREPITTRGLVRKEEE
jgi:hypothetical protein